MRSPGVIYRRYRQIKKKLLFDMMADAHKREHANCHYGKILRYKDEDGFYRVVKFCVFGVASGNPPDICTCPKECNAFALRWTKDKIVERFNETLSNPAMKRAIYPQLTVFEWVLDKELHEAMEEPRLIDKIIIVCIQALEDLLKTVRKIQIRKLLLRK